MLLFSFSLFCFGSLNASALDVSPDAKNNWFLLPFNYADDFKQIGSFDSVSGTYGSVGGSFSGQYRHFSVDVDSSAVMPIFEAGRSYLVYATFVSAGGQGGAINSASIRYTYGDWSSSLVLSNSNLIYNSSNFVNNTNSYTVMWSLENLQNSHIFSTSSQIQLNFGSSISTSGRVGWAFYALDVTDNTQEQIDSIVTAINNQTTELGGAISDSADQISGTIENQFSGEPDESFNVDNVISQHNENMGVLSFGSDVMLQFLGLFQSANVGSATLTLPGFSIEVQDVNYEVWQDHTFDFAQLEEWIPRLIDIIRLFLPAFVWLMVLRYCISVFERNFLSK